MTPVAASRTGFYNIRQRLKVVGRQTGGGGAEPRWQHTTHEQPLISLSASSSTSTVTAATVTVTAITACRGPGQLLARTTATTSRHRDPWVIGLSPSSSRQQAMAHSCLATMAVKKRKKKKKKWLHERRHKHTSRRSPDCNIQTVANRGDKRPLGTRTWPGKQEALRHTGSDTGPFRQGPLAQ